MQASGKSLREPKRGVSWRVRVSETLGGMKGGGREVTLSYCAGHRSNSIKGGKAFYAGKKSWGKGEREEVGGESQEKGRVTSTDKNLAPERGETGKTNHSGSKKEGLIRLMNREHPIWVAAIIRLASSEE